MADNFFDQFDTPTPAKAPPAPTGGDGNYFDQFDGPSRVDAAPKGYTPPVFAQMAKPPVAMQGMQGTGGAMEPLNSIAAGAAETGIGAAQLGVRGAHALLPGVVSGTTDQSGDTKDLTLADKIENIRRMGELAYQAGSPNLSRQSFDPFRTIGSGIAMGPLAYMTPGVAAPSLLARMGANAGAGALMGAVQPVDTDKTPDYWHQKLQQVATQAAVGGATPAVTAAAASIFKPRVSAAAQQFMNEGGTPTPGQMLGGNAATLEDKMTSIPVLGPKIKAAQMEAMDSFNRSSIDKALAPIGEQLNMKTPLGRDAIDEMSSKISAAYDKIVPQASVKVDQPFAQDMTQLIGMAQQGLPDAQAKQFSNLLKIKLIDRFSPNGSMTGESWKTAEGELGRLAKGYRGSADFDQRQLGDALGQAQDNLRDLLARSNPQLAPQIQAANSAYALSKRVMVASTKAGTQEPGTFTPAQLVQAVRHKDPSLDKNAFARGNALMQDFAENAKSVVGSKYPDSGTAGRHGIWQVPLALGEAAKFSPLAAAGAGGLGALGWLGYTGPGRAAITQMLQGSPGLAHSIRMSSPAITSLIGSLGGLPSP